MLQVLYAVSPIRQSKNGDRVGVLKKVDDKYNLEDVNFPASFDDIVTSNPTTESASTYLDTTNRK